MRTRIIATRNAPERAPVAVWTRLASDRKRAWATPASTGSALTTTGVSGAYTAAASATTGSALAITGVAGTAGVAGAAGVAGTVTAGVA